MRPPVRDQTLAVEQIADDQEEAEEGGFFGEGGEDEMVEMGEGGEDEIEEAASE